jgi:hypothetical protein
MFRCRLCGEMGIVTIGVVSVALLATACKGKNSAAGPSGGNYGAVQIYLIPSPAPVGTTVEATAAAFDQGGHEMTLAGPATWSSNAPTVAQVNPSSAYIIGVATFAQGQAVLSCTVGGTTGKVTLSVISNPVAAIRVTPSSVTLRVGDSNPVLTATLVDANGNPVPNDQFPPGPMQLNTWTTSDSTKAVVNQYGMVRPVAVGVATISASRYGRTGTAIVTVIP